MGSSGVGAGYRRSALLTSNAGGKKAAMLGLLLTLLLLLVAAGAQSEKASQNLPSGKYHHTDRATNKELLCDKCPAGTHVSKHCMESALRECSPCPSGTFTKHENGIERCHTCLEPCQEPMIERTPCTALSDRECTCPPGTFLSNDTCTPHSVCQAGWGVKKKGSETEDTRCKPCSRGTFSDVPSSMVGCKSHTDCLGQGLEIIKPGTKKSDNVCGATQSFSGTDTVSTEPSEALGASAALTTSPKGTHVSKHCMESALRECSPCPSGTFTKHENGIESCHACREPCQELMIERTPCTTLSDRECICPPGTFLSNDTCTPHSVCQAGWGVKKKGNETEDTRCKPCSRGTFSDVPSSVMRCKSHTDCLGQGLVIIKPGTKKSDNVCGATQSFSGTDTVSTEPSEALGASAALTTSPKAVSSGLRFAASTRISVTNPTRHLSETSQNETRKINITASSPRATKHQENHHHKMPPQVSVAKMQPAIGVTGAEGEKNAAFKASRRGPPRPNTHKHFDINEHLPWMIVLFLLLVLVVIVVCSIRRSSRVLKKGPRQDPNTIVEKAAMTKSTAPTQNREKWIYYCNGHGIDILKLVAAQVGSQWQDIYLQLCNANEHEVAEFSNGYSADHERAYAALQQWTVGPEASLAKLISALRQHRRIDVVEKIRGLMEDTPQLEVEKLSLPVNGKQPNSNGIASPKPSDSSLLTVERSPLEKNKGFFVDESEPLLRCDSTSSGSSALSRTGSFITKEKKDTVLRQVRLDPCDLQPIFDDMLHILNPDELHVIEEIPHAEDKLDRLFEIAGAKSQDASQKLLDSVYSHLPDLL
ncbi:tumor necrosis factor receptor superfamily member 21 isoform X2 [Microcaecilia unicolor]|uniref:Tumor necrosis factor receptor superfamily member 21 isoform X2 n=1 Tax=Microcaecilia unicolor TaxID=1415580 RepID=A0A6P7XQ32_9AMPH|nr:tumor necrosis factor receptor superfamily member 21 isoform X2 [Microcaecilia unicolor]